ncbi:MAG: GH129 [uncultured Chloroflexi bacterium]|uniref:GH129 n=1 Tax=uncultured Chloroflexota bacterium TaxID=166587 RepID=A0A6J4K7F0_9CHLR|nr:MAG: GH129 [uncultured Chloroflexota bacterium]
MTDKTTGVRWRPDLWFRSAGEVTLEEIAGGARLVCDLSDAAAISIDSQTDGLWVAFRGLRTCGGAELDGSAFVATLALNGDAPELRVQVEEIAFDEQRFRLVQAQYPARFGALETFVDLGALVIPHWEGAIVPTRRVTLPTVELWLFEDTTRTIGALNDIPVPTMPWYGAYLDRADHAGFACVVETAADVQFQVAANYTLQHRFDGRGLVSPLPRIAAATPVWLASHGALGYTRRATFRFGPQLDYVGMAKHYREHARRDGTFKSLAEKARERPQLARLAGAPYVALYAGYPHYAPGVHPAFAGYTYKEVEAVVRDLADGLRLPRAFVHLWGGLTQQPPGALPLDTAPGPVSDLKAAVDAAHDAGYLFTLYNDFTALLEESPLWDGRLMYAERDGQRMMGRPWNRVCASHYQDLAQRQIPGIVEALGVQAAYVDCANVFWRECYATDHPGEHPATRTQDMARRLALLRYIQELGLVFGGEHIQWWAVPAVDYCNGVGTPPAASRMLSRFPTPLWHLVFHDALVGYPHAADDYTRTAGVDFTDKLLRDLLVGVPPMYFLNLHDYPQWRDRIGQADRATGDVLRHVAFDELLDHAVLTEDRQVQRTRFSSGVEVTVNFGLALRDTGSGEPIPAKGYRVTGMGAQPISGAFQLSVTR